MNKKIGIYVRVSTEEQARMGYGLSDQERQCKKYAEIFFEDRLKDIELYKDDGYSAKDFNRPEIKRLIKDIDEKIVDTVIVFKLDRLTRSVIDVYSFISKILDKDCSLIAVLDHLDIHSANGRMFIGVLSIIAQWEREVISERTLAGLQEMATEGKYPYGGCRPFGWNLTSERYLEINKEEADLINWIIDQYIERNSICSIRQQLKEDKHCTMHWNKIKKILVRKENIGEFEYHGKIYKNIFPPILTKEKYDIVCELLKEKQISTPSVYNYSLYGLIYCGCGEKMKHQSSEKKKDEQIITYYYYYCPKCKKRISQRYLENKLLPKAQILFDTKNDKNDIKRLKTKVYNLEAKKKELYESYISNQINVDSYTYSINKIQHTQNELLYQIETLTNAKSIINEKSKHIKFDVIHKSITKVIVDPEQKKIINVFFVKEES